VRVEDDLDLDGGSDLRRSRQRDGNRHRPLAILFRQPFLGFQAPCGPQGHHRENHCRANE